MYFDAAFAIVIDTTDHVPRHLQSTAVLDLDLMRLGVPPADFERYSWEVFAEQRPLIALDEDTAAWQFFDERRSKFFQTLMLRPKFSPCVDARCLSARVPHQSGPNDRGRGSGPAASGAILPHFARVIQ